MLAELQPCISAYRIIPYNALKVLQKQERVLHFEKLLPDLTICYLRILERNLKERLTRIPFRAILGNEVRYDVIVNPELEVVAVDNRSIRILEHGLETHSELTDLVVSLGGISDTNNGIDMSRRYGFVVVIRDCELDLSIMLEVQRIPFQIYRHLGGLRIVRILKELVDEVSRIRVLVNHTLPHASHRVIVHRLELFLPFCMKRSEECEVGSADSSTVLRCFFFDIAFLILRARENYMRIRN